MPLTLSPRTRRLTSRLLALGAAVAIVSGAVLVGHPFYTDLRASRQQVELSKELKTETAKEAFVEKKVEISAPVSRLRIPAIGVDTVVVEGTTEEALRAGAGHYPESPLPGTTGNVAIAGHRTTYGKPFADLDLLKPGDQVELETPIGPFIYELVPEVDGHANPWVIEPNDWSVIDRTPEPMLTLTTCHPKRSAAQRLVARFRLVEAPDRTADA